jgi:hypothetical protein
MSTSPHRNSSATESTTKMGSCTASEGHKAAAARMQLRDAAEGERDKEHPIRADAESHFVIKQSCFDLRRPTCGRALRASTRIQSDLYSPKSVSAVMSSCRRPTTRWIGQSSSSETV